MTPEQLKDLEKQFGTQTADLVKKEIKEAEARINEKLPDVTKGLMTEKDFNDFKGEQLNKINEILENLEKIEKASKEQGIRLKALSEQAAPNSKSFEEFIIDLGPKIKALKGGEFMEFNTKALKAAGVTSISGSIQDMTSPPGSPYAPGIGGETLTIFDIVRNPNFITNRVDIGSTNSSRLAWANETDYQGVPTKVNEAGPKPLTQHKFQVEMSLAKKIASYIHITEEFDQDLPAFATLVRRMLQNDVIRTWDDTIQTDVKTIAPAYNITNLDSEVYLANKWDGLLAMLAQVRYNNFIPNTIGINPFTNVGLKTAKSTQGEYLLPSFVDEINSMLVQANKVDDKYALVGDLTQYKVDIYKDFVLKVGWINDDFITNQFCVLGEIRYHSYISDARKKALVYNNLNAVVARINGTPGS